MCARVRARCVCTRHGVRTIEGFRDIQMHKKLLLELLPAAYRQG